jgi:hypothetical protein
VMYRNTPPPTISTTRTIARMMATPPSIARVCPAAPCA